MEITETALPGVLLLVPRRFGDDRGWFSETWNARRLAEHGIDTLWVQDNHSFSAPRGTLRGLHYQAPPHAQAKLVRVSQGRALDVAVDARKGSPTYGRHVAVELTAERGEQLFVPTGFLHGFLTLEPDTHFLYKCSDYYAPEADGAVRWDSAGIDWRLADHGIEAPTLSAKDAAAPAFADWDSPFTMETP